MQGKKITKKESAFYSVMFFVVFGVGISLISKVYFISCWQRRLNNNDEVIFLGGLNNNEVIFLGLLLASFVYILNKIINRINECYSDYLDYCDMEDIKNSNVKIEEQKIKKRNDDIKFTTIEVDKNFNNEVWNNINRRAEKAKVVSLSSLKFREIKEEFADFLKKQSR